MLSEHAENLKNNLGPLLEVLRTSDLYWHTTPYNRFQKIVTEGIKPSDGSVQSDYPNSIGSVLKSVCLFDFFSVSEKVVLNAGISWDSFLFEDGAALKVFIGINRNSLVLDKLRTQNESSFNELLDNNLDKNHISQVECWYQGTIPADCFTEIILIKQMGRPFTYEKFLFRSDILLEIEPTKQKWEHLEKIKREEDVRNGIRSPAEFLLGKTRH